MERAGDLNYGRQVRHFCGRQWRWMRRTSAHRGSQAGRERSTDCLLGDCELMRRRISVRLDGRLSEPHQAELERHLDRCDACARFAHTLASLTEVLQARMGKVSCLLLLGALTIGT